MMSDEDTIVRLKHLRAAGMCNREPRKWFTANGLSWSEFVVHGLKASVLIATGDALALKVVEIARQDKSE